MIYCCNLCVEDRDSGSDVSHCNTAWHDGGLIVSRLPIPMLTISTLRAYKGFETKTTVLQTSQSNNLLESTFPSPPLLTAMFAAALLCQALLATAAFAIPSGKERLAARIARRDAGFTHQSQPSQLVDSVPVVTADDTNGVANVTNAQISYSTNWAGAVLSAKTVCRRTHLDHTRWTDPLLFLLPRPHTRPSPAPSLCRIPRSRPVGRAGTLRPPGLALTVPPAARLSSRLGWTSASTETVLATMVGTIILSLTYYRQLKRILSSVV